MREELKIDACPFCGGDGEVSWYARGSDPACAGYFVECVSCAASGQGFDIQGEMPDREEYTKQCAITAWNTRAKPPQPADDNHKALVEKVRRILRNGDLHPETRLVDALEALAAFQSRQEEK